MYLPCHIQPMTRASRPCSTAGTSTQKTRPAPRATVRSRQDPTVHTSSIEATKATENMMTHHMGMTVSIHPKVPTICWM